MYDDDLCWDGKAVDPQTAARARDGRREPRHDLHRDGHRRDVLLAWSTGAPLADSAFDAVSALATSGLSRGVTGPELDALAKLTLTACMLVGRVEIVAFIALIARRR